MARIKALERFPRLAYMRQLWDMMDALADWEQKWKAEAARTDSPTLRWKLEERQRGAHEVYDLLSKTLSSWRLWS